ncbi:hypothetical protein [Nonomuraea sp. WAC 01424]|uniref:hypothetical protein n=1 Tax=Nonomuraea sp. WAC 01424 TaxID=2203200 RepID=UPI00163B878F|nr:hypothetical protein [Nonomuraea sp. WAC 01424]
MLMTLTLSAALVLTGTPAQATKSVSFQGFTIQIPAAWKVKKDPVGGLAVVTGACSKRAAECPGFSIGGARDIAYASEGGPYKVGAPYHPSSGVMECVPDKRYWEGVQPVKPARTSTVAVGAGRTARFTEWRLTCQTKTSKPTSVAYTQRIWYLRKEKVLVVDQWKTPGLGNILAKAVWK